MMRKNVQIEVQEKRKDGGRILISTSVIDRDHDRVMPLGADITNYMKNPIVQWGHNYRDPWATIGKTTSLELTPEAIVAEFELRPPANDSDPQNIIALLWDGGWIQTASIGFAPQTSEDNDVGGKDFTQWELLEWSLVPIPANQSALRLAVKCLECEDAGKAAVPYKNTPLAPENMPWDAAAARKRVRDWADGDIAKYKQAFAWQRLGEDANNLRTYVGPHHDIVDGQLRTVWRGVMAAMGALVFGARGGRIADENERRAVYGHLRRHYADFGKDAPEFRNPSEAEIKAAFGVYATDGIDEADDTDSTEHNMDAAMQDSPDNDNDETSGSVAILAEALEKWLTVIEQSMKAEVNDGTS